MGDASASTPGKTSATSDRAKAARVQRIARTAAVKPVVKRFSVLPVAKGKRHAPRGRETVAVESWGARQTRWLGLKRASLVKEFANISRTLDGAEIVTEPKRASVALAQDLIRVAADGSRIVDRRRAMLQGLRKAK